MNDLMKWGILSGCDVCEQFDLKCCVVLQQIQLRYEVANLMFFLESAYQLTELRSQAHSWGAQESNRLGFA